MKNEGMRKEGFIGMMMIDEDDAAPALHAGMSEAQVQRSQQNGDEIFRDYMTGQILNPQLVREARQKELDVFCLQRCLGNETSHGSQEGLWEATNNHKMAGHKQRRRSESQYQIAPSSERDQTGG